MRKPVSRYEQYNTWLYDGKQIALTNAAAYEQPAFILTQYGLQDETFGIIYIPKLEVTLPLYLGANDENMANGAAVLGQTSVPIGGVNTNAVIAGHRGWNGYPYFLNLDELQIGDIVYIDNIWTLMKYEVADIQVISPDDVDAIKIQEGRDLVTLLTCHPPNTGGSRRGRCKPGVDHQGVLDRRGVELCADVSGGCRLRICVGLLCHLLSAADCPARKIRRILLLAGARGL